MSNWKFADSTNKVVYRVNEDGRIESCLVEAIPDWLAQGNKPEPADPVIKPIPQVVSKAQGLIALEMAGVLVSIETYMQTAPRLEQIAWNNIQQFERSSPLLNTLCTNFDLTQKDVDNLFINASQVVI